MKPAVIIISLLLSACFAAPAIAETDAPEEVAPQAKQKKPADRHISLDKKSDSKPIFDSPEKAEKDDDKNKPVVTIPGVAAETAADLHRQLVERAGVEEEAMEGVSLVLTTPVNLDDFERSSTLARLFAEELADWFVKAGYSVKEIRRGKNIMFDPETGEMLLTRSVRLLEQKNAETELIMVGTYAATSKAVRFNIRLVGAFTGEVAAMDSSAIPVTLETAELMEPSERSKFLSVKPTAFTMLHQ